jgi:hypothetical protein
MEPGTGTPDIGSDARLAGPPWRAPGAARPPRGNHRFRKRHCNFKNLRRSCGKRGPNQIFAAHTIQWREGLRAAREGATAEKAVPSPTSRPLDRKPFRREANCAHDPMAGSVGPRGRRHGGKGSAVPDLPPLDRKPFRREQMAWGWNTRRSGGSSGGRQGRAASLLHQSQPHLAGINHCEAVRAATDRGDLGGGTSGARAIRNNGMVVGASPALDNLIKMRRPCAASIFGIPEFMEGALCK